MKNSPYTVYQYFINTADADVERYLKLFTLLSFEDIEEIVTQHAADPAARYGQQRLAYLVTQIIFGTDAAEASVLATAFAFAKDEQKKELLEAADPGYIQMLCTQLGAGSCARGTSFLAAIADPEHGCALVSSRGEGKKLMKSGALWLNGKKITDP